MMEADDQDVDSSYESAGSIASDTTSIKSDILRYHFEHQRRYHAYKAGSYYYPNDEQALNQMDIEHNNQMLMLGKLHLSPISDPHEILDLGTGTGIWAIDVGDTYPSAIISDGDGSVAYAAHVGTVPPNVRFEIDDFNDEWCVPHPTQPSPNARGLVDALGETAGLARGEPTPLAGIPYLTISV